MDEFDDDFGDLYADVEVQASSAINATVSMKNSVCDDVGGDEEEEDAGTTGGGDEEEDESDDDSEDDLNIVLNSDDDAGNGNGTGPLVVNLVEAEDEEEEERENAGGNGFTALEGNGLDGNCEKVGGCCGERAKGGCHNQYSKYKYIRFQPAALGNKGKENGCATLSSYPCLSARADREDNGCGQRMGSSSIIAHSGHNFSLPRSRTILDVNIDIFERKPWRHAGADVTDFFNFGFDEISWKHYCNQLDIYRHKAAKPTNFRPPESFKSTEAFEAEHKSIAHIAAGRKGQNKCGRAASSMHSGEEQSEMKGRAIQVEDSIVERQPSMDLRRPPDRDSDVIQIMVQDTRENSSCTAKLGSSHDDKSLDKGSQNEDNCLDASGEFLCFSSASEDELNSESLDGHHEEVDIAVSKRSSTQTTVCHKSMDSNNHGNLQISDVDMRKNQIVAICSSEGTDEEIETPNHATKRVGGDACTTDPSIMEEESSQGEKSQYSPRSSCCEAVEVGAYIDMRESHNHRIRRPTRKSSSEFRKPVKSKRSDGKTKPTSGRHDKRYRSPLYHSNGFNGMPKSNAHFDNKNTRSFLDAEGPYDVHLSTIGHSRSKERLSPFDSYYDGKKLSYDRESELSFDFIRERFSDYEDGYEHMKYPYRKVYRRFEEETGQCIYRTSDDRGFFLDERPSVIDEDVWDWYHYETSLAVDDGGLLTNQESGQYFEDSFYLDDERGIRRKRKGDELDFRSRGEYDEVFNESKYSYDLQRERYKRSCKYDGRDSSSLEYNYDRPIPYSRREAKSPRRNKRFGSQSAGLDTYYSGDEDIYMGCRDDPSFSSRSFLEPRPSRSRRWRDTMIPKSTDCDRQGKYRKQWSERVRDNGSHGDCYNASFTEVSINNSDDYVHFGRKKPHSKYDRLRRNEEKFISRAQDDKFQVEGAPFSFERTPRCKRFDAEHGLYHVEELLEDRQAEGCRYEQRIKGSNGNQFDTPPTIRSHEQTFLNYKDSIDSDLFVGEGKSSGRYHDRDENANQNINAEQNTKSDHIDETFLEKASQADNTEVQIDQNDGKWRNKFPVTQHNEALDIEEGQIIAEEVNDEELVSTRASEVGLQQSDKKEFHHQNARNGKTVEGYDNPRILEVMAKMEKRRERFKDPISWRKDSDNSAVTNNLEIDSVGRVAQTKLQRPTRKRRWGGS